MLLFSERIEDAGPKKGASQLGRRKHTAEEIIDKLRQAEVALAQGIAVPDVCRRLGVTEQTYYRWRKEYGGPSLDHLSASTALPASSSIVVALGSTGRCGWDWARS